MKDGEGESVCVRVFVCVRMPRLTLAALQWSHEVVDLYRSAGLKVGEVTSGGGVACQQAEAFLTGVAVLLLLYECLAPRLFMDSRLLSLAGLCSTASELGSDRAPSATKSGDCVSWEKLEAAMPEEREPYRGLRKQSTVHSHVPYVLLLFP